VTPEVVPLCELCNVRIGRTPSRSAAEYWGGPGVWVTIAELNGGVIRDSKERISATAIANVMPPPVPAGTLLFSFKLSIGKMAVSGVPLYTNEAIAALAIKDPTRLDRDYLRYALMATSSRAHANHAVLGKVLNKAKVESLPIPLRSIEEQHRIVGLLARSENVVRMRRDAQDKLGQVIPALFLEHFGDPAENPKTWDVRKIGEIAAYMRYGPRFPDRDYSGGGAHILRTTDMESDGSIRWWDAPQLPMSALELEKYSIQPGTLLITRTGATIGKVALFRGGDGPCIAGAYLIELGVSPAVHPEYVLGVLLSGYGQARLTAGSRAVAQPNLNAPTIRAINIPVPPMSLQQSFSERMADVRRLTRLAQAATVSAQAVFRSLLHETFNRPA
jgi:type I restriction enzyme S subunit